MRTFSVLTPLRGLKRADGLKSPVGENEVVALPLHVYADLADSGAIKPTDLPETCPLLWPDAPDATLAPEPSQRIAVVAITDRHALVAAIADLGGIVFFVGEGLPDEAEDVLVDFSNDALLDELAVRIDEGRLAPTLLSGIVQVEDAPIELAKPIEPAQTADVEERSPPPPEAPAAPKKTAAKPKAD